MGEKKKDKPNEEEKRLPSGLPADFYEVLAETHDVGKALGQKGEDPKAK